MALRTTATRSDALPDIPTVGEFLPGLRGGYLVRPRRTEGHAGRDRQQGVLGERLSERGRIATCSTPSGQTEGIQSTCLSSRRPRDGSVVSSSIA